MSNSETVEPATDFPTPEMQVTHLLVVDDLQSSRDFYRDVLGAKLFREYGGTSVVFDFLGTWLLIVTRGEPTADKPGVNLVPPSEAEVSHEMTIRVPDCRAAYETLLSRGAEFLTPPVEYESEIRCFFRDPSGHLLEISESR